MMQLPIYLSHRVVTHNVARCKAASSTCEKMNRSLTSNVVSHNAAISACEK